MPLNTRHARHTAIVHQLRSRNWVSATSLASRFNVTQRTIYRDIEVLVSHGIPIESVPGRNGGFRLSSDQPLDSLIVDGDDALRLYILGLLERSPDSLALMDDGLDPTKQLPPSEVSASRARVLHRLASRIFFDTTDWYWRDEGSGHLATLRDALLTGTAIEVTLRAKYSAGQEHLVVKPYGMVWKGGEWWLVAAPPRSEPQRYQLNNVDRLAITDLKFTYPDSFHLQTWWRQALQDFGSGPNRVVIRVEPASREEMLRLGLKPDSEVHHDPDGTTRIVLYVDRWRWLVPLVASFGSDVVIEEPAELRTALYEHHAEAAKAYADLPELQNNHGHNDFRGDDSRLRATRGRTPDSIREQ
ncbi:helix-turn-helix transcriptional regulator [Nocardia miyunensis]|uniref:helix-turn-helix transcriptional regulator n=1 Tax=Nocardia miyunensis TaxID=282684 RepID=UPI000836A267|nr:WYL domain-containing protein [Nocardia miyunensis]